MTGSFRALRELSSHSFGYGLSTILSRLVGFLSVPILSYYFRPEEYGVISMVQVALSLAVIVAGMNIGSGVSFYFFHHDSKDTKKMVLGSGLLYVFLAGGAIAACLFFISPFLSELLNLRISQGGFHSFVPYLRIGSFYLFFGILMTAVQSILRLHKEPYKYLVCELASFSVNMIFLLLLICFWEVGIEGVFWARAAGVLVGFLVGFFYVRERFELSLSSGLLIPILAYSLPQFPAALMGWAQTQSSRLFINYFTDLHQQGVFAVAFAFASVLSLGNAAFRLAYDPFALSIMKTPNAKKTYAEVYSAYVLLFGILLLCFTCFAQCAINFLTPREYHDAHLISYFLAGCFFMTGCNNILGTGIWVSGKTIYSSYCQVFNFITVIGCSILLIPVLKGLGAAIALFGGSVLHSMALFVVSGKLYKVEYRYFRSLFFVGSAVFFSFAFGSLNSGGQPWPAFLHSLLLFLLLSFLHYLLLAPRGTLKLMKNFLYSKGWV